jgi:glycosyltransferase involved in cell wall biosynthesis
VKIITTFYDNILLKQDLTLIEGTSIKIIAAVDLRNSSLSNFLIKLERKLSVLLINQFKIETPYALGYGLSKYLRYVKNNPADLYICHQELATYVGVKLAKKGKDIAFDLEDWYSKDLLPEAQKKRPLKTLENTERDALKLGTCWTTSKRLANALSNYYQSPEPKIIYNVFPKPKISYKQEYINIFKLFWFSQTIGAGRGLEELITGLKVINCTFELHLLGNVSVSYTKHLIDLSENKFNIHFHSIVTVDALPSFIAQFDLGLALELSHPESRNCTITNKFFQYLQSGIPVLASDTDGQKEILEKFEVGVLIKLSEYNWVKQLQFIIEDANYYQRLKKNVILAAEKFNWELEQKKLLEIVNNALYSV